MARKRRFHIRGGALETGGVIDADVPDPVDVRELAGRSRIGDVAPSENELSRVTAHPTSLANDVQNQGGGCVSCDRHHSVRGIAGPLTAVTVRISSNVERSQAMYRNQGGVAIVDLLRQSERQIRCRVFLWNSGLVLDRDSCARPRPAIR